MTKLQALFVLYWRHEDLGDCSWRKLAENYINRYEKISGIYVKGKQIIGKELELQANKILVDKDNPKITPLDYCLGDCNLKFIKANLKRHIK